ncbi:MAG: TraR/DksA C4-type zinc finger protein [Candidatus Paceibacterota bacterium]
MNENKFKELLLAEKTRLEAELATVGRKNPENPDDWEATPSFTEDSADLNEFSDSIDNFETNTAILKQLETQYNDVKDALERIENGTYGVCEVSGEEIEEERLEANPSARTCKEHMNE